MRLSGVVLLGCLVFFCSFSLIRAQESTGSSDGKKDAPASVAIVMSRPINVASGTENKWVPALIEAAFEFKFAAINGISVISSEDIARFVKGHHDFQKVPQQSDYLEAAKRLGVPYLLDQKYELTRDKMIYYYSEIISVNDGKLFTTVEKTFKADQFGASIDELVGLIMVAFNITPQKELARFVRMPAVGSNYKNISLLGDLIVRERYEQNSDSSKLADEYRVLCEKDRSLLLGYYRAGLFFESIGRNADATEALNILFMTIPEYTPVYVPLVRTFRKAKRNEDAIRIALLGQKKGIKSSELTSELAIAYTAAGKKKEAEDVFKSIMSSDPQDPFALLFYARKKNDEGNGTDALGYADRLLKLNAERGWAQVERGRALMQLSRKEEAITALVEATTLLPAEIDPVRYLGDLYEATGQYYRALEQYEKVLKKSESDIDIYIKAASLAQNAGDTRKALSLLYSIESRFSNHGGLQRFIGLLELATGDSTKAKTHLEAAVRSGAEDAKVLTELGKLYIRNKDYDKAFTNLTKALTLAKEKDTVRAGLVIVYLKKGEAGSALSILESMKSCQDQIPDLNRMIADAFFERKQYDKALIYYRKELAVNTSDTALQVKIAEISFKSEPPMSSKNEYLKLVKVGAGGTEAIYKLVILFLKLKDSKSADLYFEKAVAAGDADASTWSQIGQEYVNLGITGKAIEAYERSVRKNSSSEEEKLKLLSLYKKMGKDSVAAELYYDLYSMNKTNNSKYLLDAAKLFEKAGASDKAARMYSAALDKNIIDSNGKIKLAEAEFESGNFSKVISLLSDLSAAYVTEKEARILAESYFAVGDFKKALENLTFVLQKNPQDIRAIELSACISDTLGRYDDAVKYYSKYLMTKGKNLEYAYRLGVLYEKLNQASLAMTQYSSNIRNYPEDYRSYDRLSRLYVEANKLSSAIPVLKKAVTFKEAQADLNGMLARALMGSGAAAGQEAITQYEAYLQKNGNDYDGWVQLGNLYNTQGKYLEAATAFEKALSIRSNDFKVIKFLGKVYLKLSRTSQALDMFSRARNLNPDDPELLKMLIDGNRAAGNTRVLIDLLKELAAKNPSSFDIQLELGTLLVKQGMESDAVAVLETAAGLRKCQVEVHLQLARLYEKSRNDERRMHHITAASICSPGNPQLNIELGRYNLVKKNFTKAEGYLLAAYKVNKSNAELCYLLGSAQRELKKFTTARVYLQKAAQLDPQNQEYGLASAELLYSEGKYADALKLIQPAISQATTNASALRIAGLIYKSTGDNDRALQLLENAVISDPSCIDCQVALGDLYQGNADFKKAAEYYEKAVNSGGENDVLVAKLAESYVKLQRYDLAKKMLVKVVQKDPKNSEALYRLCHQLISEREYDEVRRYLQVRNTTKSGWYYLIEAELNEVQGNINAATAAYTKAIKMLPDVSEAQAGCGRIYLLGKKYANAIMYLGQAMAGDPNNIQLYMDLGKAYEGSGDFATALELYKEVETRMADHPEVHYCMARVYSRQNDHFKAVDALYAGIARNKKSVLLYIALGHEYRLMKQWDKAIDAYLRATKIDESRGVDGYKFVGHIYYSLKDLKKARKYYEMYISAGGKDSKISALINKLPY